MEKNLKIRFITPILFTVIMNVITHAGLIYIYLVLVFTYIDLLICLDNAF